LGSLPSIHTRRRYKKDIVTWQRWCQAHGVHALDGSALNAQLFSEWLEMQYTSSSVLSRYSGVTRWFDALLAEGVIKGHGFRNVKLPKRVRSMSRVVIPTESELGLLMDAAAKKGPRWEWVAGMVAYGGLDVAEAMRVRSTDIRTWEGRTLVKVVSRRGNRREVPVDGRLEVVTLGLAAVFAPTSPMGPSLTGKYVAEALGVLAREACGRPITVQDLRRYAVKRQAERGVPIPVIAKWLGHTTDLWVRQTLGMLNPVAEVSQADVVEMILVEPDGGRFGSGSAPDSLLDGIQQQSA
jgi:integrase